MRFEWVLPRFRYPLSSQYTLEGPASIGPIRAVVHFPAHHLPPYNRSYHNLRVLPHFRYPLSSQYTLEGAASFGPIRAMVHFPSYHLPPYRRLDRNSRVSPRFWYPLSSQYSLERAASIAPSVPWFTFLHITSSPPPESRVRSHPFLVHFVRYLGVPILFSICVRGLHEFGGSATWFLVAHMP
jgi:hypothetical protein